MKAKQNGGPAFPGSRIVAGDNYNPPQEIRFPGMTLRDYFAGKALEGALAHGLFNAEKGEQDYAEYLAHIAFRYADAMIRARSE